MSSIPNEASERTIFDIVLPGTHDSGAYRVPLRDSTPSGAPLILAMAPLRWFLRRTIRDFSRTQFESILGQLNAGARYQDFRISMIRSSSQHSCCRQQGRNEADVFWLVHGAAACVPLSDVLNDMATFSSHFVARGLKPPTVVTVARLLGKSWTQQALSALAERFVKALGRKSIYSGTVGELRNTPYDKLPAHVITGIPGLSDIPLSPVFGGDIWIDTYNMDEKATGLASQVRAVKPRSQRNDLYVLGWTVTPQSIDFALRLLTLGFARPSLERRAFLFNRRFSEFCQSNRSEISSKVNVVFFDFITEELCAIVDALNESGAAQLRHREEHFPDDETP